MAGGKRPCFPPWFESRIKAEFGYDDRKGVGACGRGPSGLGRKYLKVFESLDKINAEEA